MKFSLLASALCLTAACGGTDSVGTNTGAQIFIANTDSFVGFESWESFPFDSVDPNDTHTSGHRIVYLNKRPDAGATAFPVGTIIVKQITPGTDTAKTFAMVKRGGTYNSDGAPGWEWFELDPSNPDSAPHLIWHGVTPLMGENYTGSSSGSCNDCHGADKTNDSVLAAPLLLSNL